VTGLFSHTINRSELEADHASTSSAMTIKRANFYHSRCFPSCHGGKTQGLIYLIT
jgi:hypothetical protein